MLAVDVGYSTVKAVSEVKRVMMPSVVAPYREGPLADLAGNAGTGYDVSIRRSGESLRYFVGDLALREGQAATFTLDCEKHMHPNHDVLILAAARLLNAAPLATLAVGLPVAYYKHQKDDLRRHLENLSAEVCVQGGPWSRVSFGRVTVYPQGAGALLTVPELPTSGLVLLVDVGYKTTDFVTAEVASGMVRPVSALSGSVETGVYNVEVALAEAYGETTGVPVSMLRLREVENDGGRMCYYGRQIDLSGALEKAKKEVTVSIIDQVRARLGDRAAFIRRAYLAGGGAYSLPQLASIFPVTSILPEAQWANALGYLKGVRQLEAKQNKG